MAEKTTHLLLVKPLYSEDADIQDINNNMDIIDEYVYNLAGNVNTFETATAPVFNASTAYSAGTYVIYGNELYYLPDGHTAGVTWANTTKTKKTIIEIISDIYTHVGAQIDDAAGAGVTNKAWSANKLTLAINAILTMVAPIFDQATSNPVGTYVIYNSELYFLPNGHTAGATWGSIQKTKQTIGDMLLFLLDNAGVQINDTAGEGDTEDAWSANKIVTELAKVLAVIAPVFDQGAANDAGSYVTHNGELYYLASGHTAGVAWSNTTKEKKTVGEMLAYIMQNSGAQIDDTAGAGNTTNVWSVNKVITAINAIIDDTTGYGDMANTWSADKLTSEIMDVFNSIAPNFVQAAANDAGSYVIYGKEFYYLPNGHAANMSWSNTTKMQKTVAEVLVGLRTTVITDDGEGNVTIY